MSREQGCLGTQHDWMACGSTEVCIICGASRARKDLPPWQFDRRGRIDRGKKKTAYRRKN